jgi:2,3-bisphosphoglycerate-dependent phosphoglycerate mutase
LSFYLIKIPNQATISMRLLYLPLLLLQTPAFADGELDSTTPYIRDAKSMEMFVRPAADRTTIIMLRHAEKSSVPVNDPALSVDGMSRANELSQLFSTIKVDRIYSTPFKRTRQTVTPLALSKSIDVVEYPASMTAAQLKQKILAENTGKVVVVVGHSNTIPDLNMALSGEAASITETDFDNIYVVTVGDKKIANYHLEYGKLTQ